MGNSNRQAFGVLVVGFGECLMAGVVAGPLANTFPLWAAWTLFAFGMTSVLVGGLIFTLRVVRFPLWLRSRRWAKKEHDRIIKDQDDPIHSDYMAGTGKYPAVPEFRRKAADKYLSELIRMGLRKPWERLWVYLVIGILIIVAIGGFAWFHEHWR